jgi:hypothetical protein
MGSGGGMGAYRERGAGMGLIGAQGQGGGVAGGVAAGRGAKAVKRCGVVGVCVFVVVVLGVFVVGGASASASGGFPGYYRCVKAEKVGKAYTGEYSERECETKAVPAKTGKYQLQQVSSGSFEATGRGATLLTRSTKGVVESIVCKRSLSRGELLQSDVYATDKITLEGCVGNGEKKTDPCGNVGVEAIQTSPLFSTLVWLNKSSSEAGVLLEGEAEQFAKFKCGAEQVDVQGYLIGAIENTRKGHSIVYALNASGQQAHRSVWVFGGEILSLCLYTQTPAPQTETTLQATQTQAGTGAY